MQEEGGGGWRGGGGYSWRVNGRGNAPTDHPGHQVSGWKSLMDRQSRVLGLNRPLGVSIMIEGGRKG